MRIGKGLAFVAFGAAALLGLGAGAAADVQGTRAEQALHLSWIDRDVDPAHDFYRWAVGGWQRQNPIPPEYSRWGTFDVLRRQTEDVLRGILERAAADTQATAGSIEQKIGDFYASGMDEAAVDAAGLMPLVPELARLEEVTTRDDIEGAIAHLATIGVEAGFSFGQMTDFKNSDVSIGAAFQGGLGLPDRAFYLEPGFVAVRDAYAAHVARLFELAGESSDEATDSAAAILKLETRLAKATLPRAALRDPHAIYNIMDKKELAQLTPHFSWDTFFADVGRPDIQRINVGTPSYFEALDGEIRTAPLDTLRAYLEVRLLSAYAPFLSRAFQDESFHMQSALTGAREMLPRWLRVLHAADSALGFALGQKYVEQAFPPAARASAVELLHGIRAALEEDLATVSWMSPATRAEAVAKLAQMGERIGYPDKWRDYGPLVIDKGPWVLNVLRGRAFEERRELDKIDRPVDRTEWEMTPQTVNAYYDPSTNDINFPAAILQAPFFDPAAPLAMNEGAIGFVMGHEMTHGFDDEGAQFDGKGNLRNWWTPEDLAHFRAQTSCIADQFSRYEVEGVHLDGLLVVGEATADLGGLTLAYRAFHAAMRPTAAPYVSGFSPNQQFFLAAAHVWAQNVRPEEARLRATTDPHPPAQFRVNGTVANMPEFQEAFDVPDDSPMVHVPRCIIW
jgi:putative endopeptidase